VKSKLTEEILVADSLARKRENEIGERERERDGERKAEREREKERSRESGYERII
jgi:hypothetical protein